MFVSVFLVRFGISVRSGKYSHRVSAGFGPIPFRSGGFGPILEVGLLPFMRVLRSDVHILRLYAVFYIFYFLRNANSHRIAAITLTQSSAMTLCAALSG